MGKSQKEQVNSLKESLFLSKKLENLKLTEKKLKKANDFCKGYKCFLDKAKTEREAVKETLARAIEQGFVEFDAGAVYKPGDKVYYVNREKAIILAIIGKKGTTQGVRIAAAHIDSPRLDLKPNPLYESDGLALFKTHYYGGIKKYQWTAIPLSIHGKVVKTNGKSIDICIGEEEGDPCFCITDLLPHLAKDQMKKTASEFFSGEDLNALVGSLPFDNCTEEKDTIKLNVLKILNDKYDIHETDFVSAELTLVPAFKAVDIGFDSSMIGAYGQDDRVCAYSSIAAIFECSEPEHTVITVLADKEEIGSEGNTGMNSSFFKYFVADLANQDGLKGRHVLSKSKCLSADVNGAYDPNYASCFEATNSCYINKGVAISKCTGSGGKYDSSDASSEFMAEIIGMLESNNILWQSGELGKVDSGGGGTVAKYIANLNADVLDLGVPVLSMHAPFEIVSKIDVYMTYLAIKSFFETGAN